MAASKIVIMGHFTAIGMRTKVEESNALIINTCSDNDTPAMGFRHSWSWANPTNCRFDAIYSTAPGTVRAVSVECLWQGTKIFDPDGVPDDRTLSGDWRRGKGRRPIGSWAGIGQPLITDPGEARRKIYIPAYATQIRNWLYFDKSSEVSDMVQAAKEHSGPVYLRDFDTGRGVNRKGPMSHAWLLAHYLNTGEWPTE